MGVPNSTTGVRVSLRLGAGPLLTTSSWIVPQRIRTGCCACCAVSVAIR